MDRIKIMKLIAEEWNKEGIEYAVAHGVEKYPVRIGRDLDVFIKQRDVLRAKNIALSILRSMGVSKISSLKWDPWPRAAAIFVFESGVGWELDLITSLKWGPVTLVEEVRPTKYCGVFKVDPWASFAKNIVLKVLGGVRPTNYRLEDFEEDIVQEQCRKLFGDKLALYFLQAIKREDWEYVWQLSPKLRMTAILRHFIYHPLLTFKNCILWPVHEVRPFTRRILPVCVLIGADNSLAEQCVNVLKTREWFITGVETKSVPHNLLGVSTRFAIWRRLGGIVMSRLYFLLDNYSANTLKLVLYVNSGEAFESDNNKESRSINSFLQISPKFDMVVIIGERKSLEKSLVDYFKKRGIITSVSSAHASPEEVARTIEALCMEDFFARRSYEC